MLEFNRVLIPLDFSDFSRRTLIACSKMFSAQTTREFHFVYVWRPPVDMVVDDDPKEGIEDKLREMVAGFSHQGKHERVVKLLCGHAATEICEYALNNGCELIVLATHGRTGLRHMLMGSTAEQVVRHAPCPVLTIRQPKRRG